MDLKEETITRGQRRIPIGSRRMEERRSFLYDGEWGRVLGKASGSDVLIYTVLLWRCPSEQLVVRASKPWPI